MVAEPRPRQASRRRRKLRAAAVAAPRLQPCRCATATARGPCSHALNPDWAPMTPRARRTCGPAPPPPKPAGSSPGSPGGRLGLAARSNLASATAAGPPRPGTSAIIRISISGASPRVPGADAPPTVTNDRQRSSTVVNGRQRSSTVAPPTARVVGSARGRRRGVRWCLRWPATLWARQTDGGAAQVLVGPAQRLLSWGRRLVVARHTAWACGWSTAATSRALQLRRCAEPSDRAAVRTSTQGSQCGPVKLMKLMITCRSNIQR
eukprot:COSAG01_NODE_959_length_12451_cov_18.389815_12_plen_264_part_00